ncbi:histidine phosphatase family protein [Furfurilactobacillus siliginis]|nr:histidine phosphatase family protein [Furfurilactobacillus siliginis]
MRHATTYANEQRILQGRLDTQLTDLTPDGIALARKQQQFLSQHKMDVCFSSPLKRATSTAKILFQNYDVLIKPDPRLVEVDYGIWNGTSIDELKQKHPRYWDSHLNDMVVDESCNPERESENQVLQRITSFKRMLETDYRHKQVVVVTHGYIISKWLELAGTSVIEPVQNLQTITLPI